MGEKLSFYLSLGLFSSFNVDSGTRLLLKTMAQQDIIPEKGDILDAGCGTGVIAVSLKKKFPELNITAADRDALALYFTEKNASLNKIQAEGFSAESGLLPGSLKNALLKGHRRFDLIVSNIPAKAGKPIIEDFLQNCGLHISKDGKAAVVIVKPLSDFAEETLIKADAEILYRESNKQYSVFHFIPEIHNAARSFSDIYSRTESRITGFYGQPEFDSVSYETKLTIELVKNFGCRGKTLIWNPGIGHIPCSCKETDDIIMAGSDLLQLKASDYNLAGEHSFLHIPKYSMLSGRIDNTFDQIICIPRFISSAAVEKEIISTSGQLLEPKGRLIVSGKSSDIAKIDKIKQGFNIKKSVKFRGFRSLLLEKL